MSRVSAPGASAEGPCSETRIFTRTSCLPDAFLMPGPHTPCTVSSGALFRPRKRPDGPVDCSDAWGHRTVRWPHFTRQRSAADRASPLPTAALDPRPGPEQTLAMIRGPRALLLALYLLQTAVLAPLHEHAELAPAADGPGLVLRAICAGAGECPDPEHHHRPGDPHRAGECATCAVAGRPALLAPTPALAAHADLVLSLAPISSTPPASPLPAHRSPRGPPAAFST